MKKKEQAPSGFDAARPYSRASILAARYGRHTPPMTIDGVQTIPGPTLAGTFVGPTLAAHEEDYSDTRIRHMPSREAAEAEAADPNSTTRQLMLRNCEAVLARKLNKGYRALGPLETVQVSVVHNLGPRTIVHGEYDIVVRSYCRLVKV